MSIRNRIHATVAPDLTYEQYCQVLSYVEGKEVAWSFSLPGPLLKWVEEFKEWFDKLAEEVDATVAELVTLFRNRDLYSLLKAFRFSLQKIYKAVTAFTKLVPGGIIRLMRQLEQTGVVKQLKEGAITIDQVLERHPLLKRLSGPALAGLLIYIWLNMSFVGDLEYDMDISTIIDAFTGHFSVHDLFLTDQGMAMLALFGIGAFTGIGVVWLGSSVFNLLIALCFTTAKKMHKNGTASKLKRAMVLKRI